MRSRAEAGVGEEPRAGEPGQGGRGCPRRDRWRLLLLSLPEKGHARPHKDRTRPRCIPVLSHTARDFSKIYKDTDMQLRIQESGRDLGRGCPW